MTELDAFCLQTALEEFNLSNPNNPFTLDFMELLASQPNCFHRSCFTDGHITGSGWVLDSSRRRVLLTHHRKLNIWVQLGGHSDGESNTLLVASREAEEESSLKIQPITPTIFDIDIHNIPARGAEPSHKHYDVRFVFDVIGSEAFKVSSESHALKWVELNRVAELTTEASILRMVKLSEEWL